MGEWSKRGNGENGEMGKREKWRNGDGDGDRGTSPQNSPIPIFPKWGNGEGWGRVGEVGMGIGGPISIPISPMCNPNLNIANLKSLRDREGWHYSI